MSCGYGVLPEYDCTICANMIRYAIFSRLLVDNFLEINRTTGIMVVFQRNPANQPSTMGAVTHPDAATSFGDISWPLSSTISLTTWLHLSLDAVVLDIAAAPHAIVQDTSAVKGDNVLSLYLLISQRTQHRETSYPKNHVSKDQSTL